MKTKLLVLLLSLASVAAIAQDNLQQAIDKIASPYVSAKQNHALVIGIVNETGQHFFVYGENEKGSGKIPDSLSVFEIGDVTSVFTTTLLSVMEGINNIELIDPVQKYFPENINIPVYQKINCTPIEQQPSSSERQIHTIYYCYPDASFHPRQILLCDLASHTSGMPPYPGNLHHRLNSENPFADYTTSDLYSFLNNYYASYPTGLKYKYSPVGIAMLGNGLAWKAGMDYEKLLQKKILQPLQLKNTFVSAPVDFHSPVMTGHNIKGKAVIPGDFDAMSPALGLHSTPADLLTFVATNLNMKTTTADLQKALVNTQYSRVAIEDDKMLRGSYAAFGWINTPLAGADKTDITWQHGKTAGFAAYVGFIKADNSGIVVLSNSANPVDELGIKILQLMHDEQAKKVSSSMK